MRAHRALALLATAGAMLVATASFALVGPGAAVAAPAPKPAVPSGPQGYPLPPPALATNRGTVKVGQKVHLSGNHFGYREKVVIIVEHGGRLIVTTDQFGRFRLNVTLTTKGTITIIARGKVSHLSASVTIKVIGHKGMGQHVVPAAPHVTPVTPLVVFTPLLPDNTNLGLGAGNLAQNATGSANLVANSDELTPASDQFPLGAVGAVAALLGVALVVVLTVKRRRAATQD